MDASQSALQDLTITYQNLMELVRMHPEDNNLYICFVEAENQLKIAWTAYDTARRKLL